MAITTQQIEQFNLLSTQKAELEIELNRINGFLAREPQNKDNGRAINGNKIFVKFAGTACMLPIGVFKAELTKRKKEIEDEIEAIDTEISLL